MTAEQLDPEKLKQLIDKLSKWEVELLDILGVSAYSRVRPDILALRAKLRNFIRLEQQG